MVQVQALFEYVVSAAPGRWLRRLVHSSDNVLETDGPMFSPKSITWATPPHGSGFRGVSRNVRPILESQTSAHPVGNELARCLAFVDGDGTTSCATAMSCQPQGTRIVFVPVLSFAYSVLKSGNKGRTVGSGHCGHTGRAVGRPPAPQGGGGFAPPARKTRLSCTCIDAW